MRAVHQHRQPAGQPGQQMAGRQHRQPGRGQLDGQRDPVQPAADLGDGPDRRLVRRELHAGRLGPVQEQPHGRPAVLVTGTRQRQRGDRVLAPGPDPQRRPAGDQHDQAGAGFQQPDHGVPGGQHVLEVVQHDEHPAIAQRGPQPAVQRGRVPVVHAQLPGHGIEHETRVAQRRQVGEYDPVRVVARHLPGHLDGQPGLADAARAGEDQQLRVAALQQPDHGGGEPGPADQRGQRPGDGSADGHSPFGPALWLGPGRGQQARPLTRTQAQRIGQQPDRVEPRRAARIPLQVADGLGADPGPLGQPLLGQTRGQASLPQQLTERGHRAKRGVFGERSSCRPAGPGRRLGGMSPENLKIRARRLVEEVLNQGDLAVANELMSPTCVHHVPGAELAPGPASLRDWLSRTLRIFPDFHAIVEDEFATGDRVAQRITAYGTHQGTGQPVEFAVLEIARAGPDGRIAEHWCSADLLSVLRQIGGRVQALRQVS